MYVLGIDGGGTRTTGVVADHFGNVYMHTIAGRSNPNTLSQSEFESVLNGLLRALSSQNSMIFNQISMCFAGIAGVGESGQDKKVVALLQEGLPPNTTVIVQNDAMNALYSGTLGKAGIVQIAGTGAITLGINEEGKMSRTGGWGYLFDDEGSGYYLGNLALKSIFRSYDKRGPATTLTDRILAALHVERVPDMITKIYGNVHPRSVIAPLARFVVEEALANDQVAIGIVEKACEEMMYSIQTCHNRLFDKNHETTIVLSGGVFSQKEIFMDRFIEMAKETLPNATFCQTQVPPVGGAVLAGIAQQGERVAPDFISRLNSELLKEVNR